MGNQLISKDEQGLFNGVDHFVHSYSAKGSQKMITFSGMAMKLLLPASKQKKYMGFNSTQKEAVKMDYLLTTTIQQLLN